MAVFGFNLTVSILGLFFLRKLIPAFDFPSKLLTGFYRFYAPSENECRQAAQLKPKTVKKLLLIIMGNNWQNLNNG